MLPNANEFNANAETSTFARFTLYCAHDVVWFASKFHVSAAISRPAYGLSANFYTDGNPISAANL